jgi:toxin YoeB
LALKNSSDGSTERFAAFEPEFIRELRELIQDDKRVALRAIDIIEAIMREPFSGIGKPEPLKHKLRGAWSRRLTDEHRVVYFVSKDRVTFLQAMYHYGP